MSERGEEMNTDNELLIKLDALISNWEDETVEFKEAIMIMIKIKLVDIFLLFLMKQI